METPTHYNDVCQKALEVKEKYDLTDVQTLLYNHICRGDFKLRNGDGQQFHDKNNNGFGWSSDRNCVKKHLKPLIKDGLVKLKSIRDCHSGRYTSWYFYCPEYSINDLVTASNFTTTYYLALIKHYLNLEDGFDKKNKKYGDIEFIHNEKGYTFKYKGEENIYLWDGNGDGIKIKDDFGIMPGVKLIYYTNNFQELVHDIWSVLAYNGYQKISEIPNYTNSRKITI